MRGRLGWCLLVSVIFLTGCQQLQIKGEDLGPIDAPQALDQSRLLVKQGRWEEAIVLLEHAKNLHPDNKAIGDALVTSRNEWHVRQRTLEDLILIYETDALYRKIPVMEKLLKAQPKSYFIDSKLLIWKRELKGSVGDLLACGSFHLDESLRISKLCLELAKKIEPGSQTEALYDMAMQREEHKVKKEQKRKADEQKKKRVVAAVSRAGTIKQLSAKAEALAESGNYPDAMTAMNSAIKLDPNNGDLKQKRQALQILIDEQVVELDAVAERLYREEHLEAAVAAWETALKLSPGSHEITAKIKRAKTVLKKIQHLESTKTGSNR